MFSPMKRPEVNPVWSSFIIYGKICLSLSAMHADANLYDVFKKKKKKISASKFLNKIYLYFLWASML